MTLPYTCTFRLVDYARAHQVEEIIAMRFWGSPEAPYVRTILNEMSTEALREIRASLLSELDNHFAGKSPYE